MNYYVSLDTIFLFPSQFFHINSKDKCVCVCVCARAHVRSVTQYAQSLSHVQLFGTRWSVSPTDSSELGIFQARIPE